MDEKEREYIESVRKRQDREHWPRLIMSIIMMIMGVAAILVLMWHSAPKPG